MPVTGQNAGNVTLFKLRPVGELNFLRSLCKVFLAKLIIFLHKSIISNIEIICISHAGEKKTLWKKHTVCFADSGQAEVVYFYRIQSSGGSAS